MRLAMVKKQRTENRNQGTEVRGQMTEVRGQTTDDINLGFRNLEGELGLYGHSAQGKESMARLVFD